MFFATALNDSLKPEVQVCLQAWGGIGAYSMDSKSPWWLLSVLARASAAPDLAKAGGCSQCPAQVFCVDGLHTTSDGHVGIGISDLRGNVLLASSISQDLSLNRPGVHQTPYRKTSCY